MSNVLNSKKLQKHKMKKQLHSKVEEERVSSNDREGSDDEQLLVDQEIDLTIDLDDEIQSILDEATEAESQADKQQTDVVEEDDILAMVEDTTTEEVTLGAAQQDTVAEDEENLIVLDETAELLEEVPEHFANIVEQKKFIQSTRVFRKNSSVQGAALAIVNHKNSQRSQFSKPVANKLDFKAGDYLQIHVEKDGVYVLKSTDEYGIPVRKGNCIYSKELVELISKTFGLNFTNTSTQHLMSVQYKRYQDRIVAVIK